MNTFKTLFLSFLASVGIAGCSLDTAPTDSVNTGIAFSDAATAENVLNGSWRYLMDSYFTYANPGWYSLMLTSDAMASDVAVQPGRYGYLAHYAFTNVVVNNSTTVRGVWTRAYKVIDNTNHIITKIETVPGDAALKARVKAQALALRGYLYLYLGTYFAEAYSVNPNSVAVPVYTEPSYSATPGGKPLTLEAVYAQAENDLQEAFRALDGYTRDEQKQRHKINKNVVAGILARLYQLKGDWDNASKYAAEARQGYSLMEKNDYLGGFNSQNNAEWIWGHPQTTEQSVASYSFHFLDVSSAASYYYSFMADPNFKDFFDADDVRTQLFEWDTRRYRGGLLYKKFIFRSDLTADLPLMRAAEMVLIEAEALAEADKLPEAIIKLNELREKRGADTPDLSALSKNELIDVILIERRKELFGEGFGLYDIKRRQKSVERKEARSENVPGTSIGIRGHTILKFPDGSDFKANSPYYIFAIPETETLYNDNF